MSSASLPDPRRGAPGVPAPPRPQVVPPAPPERPRRRAMGWVAAAVVAAAGIGGYFWQQSKGDGRSGGGGPGGPASLATATIVTGDLDRTVRLSGSISAERFAALLVPQLRGTRGARGGGGGGGTGAGGTRSGGSGGSSGSSSGSSTSGSQSASSVIISSNSGTGSGGTAAPASSNTAIASGAGGGSASLGAIRGSTNRFGDRKTATSSSSAAGGAASSSTSGLGSSAGALLSSGGGGRGGGGGGGGMMNAGGDFSLVLTFLAPGGVRVKKGDVVAEFDRQNMMNRIEDYKANVVQSEMSLKKMKADLQLATVSREQQILVARSDIDKAKLDLKTIEVISDIDAQRLKLAADEAEAKLKQMLSDQRFFDAGQRSQLRVAEIELSQNKLELQRAQTNVDKMQVKAPMDGIVVRQNLRRGMEMATVEQGDQLFPGMMFMQIVDSSSMVLNANVNQVDSEQLRIGMRARVKLDAYPGVELPAKLYSIGAVPVAGRRANWMKEIRVRLKLEANDGRIIPDLSASADVTLDRVQNATLAPLNAVQVSDAGKPFVMVKSGTEFVRRDVDLGLRNSLRVAVKSGLTAGDVVAVPSAAPADDKEQKAAAGEPARPGA